MNVNERKRYRKKKSRKNIIYQVNTYHPKITKNKNNFSSPLLSSPFQMSFKFWCELNWNIKLMVFHLQMYWRMISSSFDLIWSSYHHQLVSFHLHIILIWSHFIFISSSVDLISSSYHPQLKFIACCWIVSLRSSWSLHWSRFDPFSFVPFCSFQNSHFQNHNS